MFAKMIGAAAATMVLTGMGAATASASVPTSESASVAAPAGRQAASASLLAGGPYRVGPWTVNRRAHANTQSEIWGTLAPGSEVRLACYRHGETVSGPYGTSNIWDKLEGGGWVADTYIYTASNNPVVRPCWPWE